MPRLYFTRRTNCNSVYYHGEVGFLKVSLFGKIRRSAVYRRVGVSVCPNIDMARGGGGKRVISINDAMNKILIL